MVNIASTKKMTPRLRTKLRIRKRMSGTSERPRLSVFKSVHHIYAQLISDVDGKTIASASTLDKEVKAALKDGSSKSIAAAKVVGTVLAKRGIEKKVTAAVFDRNGFQYTGRIKALSEGAREGGLQF